MTATDHLAKARDYIAIAESGDSKIAAYKGAADEINAAKAEAKADGKRLTNAEIASQLKRPEQYVQKLSAWGRENQDPSFPPFGGPAENEARYKRADRRRVENVIADRPEVVAAAIAKAPADLQRRVADELAKQPATERSLRKVVEQPKPSRPPAPDPEKKLGEAVFSLWEVGELLLDSVPGGESRVRMTALAEKAERLSGGILHLIGTGELEAEFQALVEKGAEA